MSEGAWRRDAGAAWRVAVVFAVAGLGVGLLWVALAPSVPIEVRDDGFYLASDQPGEPFATQAVFALLGFAAGLVAGGWAWLKSRRTPWGALAGLVLGGLGCALLAWRLGVWLGPPPLRDLVGSVDPGDSVEAPLAIDAYAVLLAPAIGAVLAYLLLDLLLEEKPPVTDGPAEPSPPPSA